MLMYFLCMDRNGGHERPVGLQDHHLLHYLVSAACTLQLFYLWHATGSSWGDLWYEHLLPNLFLRHRKLQ